MTARNILLTSKSVLIKHLILTAANQTRMSINACDQTVAIPGNGESRERPESSFTAFRTHRSGTLETDNSWKDYFVLFNAFLANLLINLTLWIADLQQLIRPVASMNAFVIHQSRFTRTLMWHSERTLQEASRALVTVRVDSKGKLTAGRGEGHLIVFPSATIHRPVVVAMIVHGAFAIEQETVLALLKGQCA